MERTGANPNARGLHGLRLHGDCSYNPSAPALSSVPHTAPTPVLRFASLFAALYLFWLLLSGYFTAFLLTAGAASAAAVVWFSRRMDVVDAEGHPMQLGAQAWSYWPWLAVEIMKSAWSVSRIILDPRLPISPTLVRFKPGQHSDLGLVVHANSITLTPGTITVEAGAREFLVHGLTRDAAEGCIGSEMDRRVTAFEARGAM